MINQVSKLIVISIIWCFSQYSVSAAVPTVIPTYLKLVEALKQGHDVKAVLHVNKCTSSDQYKVKYNAFWSMNFTNFWQYTFATAGKMKEGVSISVTLLVHQAGNLNYNYVRMRIYYDESAEVLNEYIDPSTFEVVRAMHLNCQLSNGYNNKAIVLYDLSR